MTCTAGQRLADDAAKAREIEARLDRLAAACNVLPMDAVAFRTWAQLRYRWSDTLCEDAMIAATAKVHGLTVATRYRADFSGFGVPLLDPFVGLVLDERGERISRGVPGPRLYADTSLGGSFAG